MGHELAAAALSQTRVSDDVGRVKWQRNGVTESLKVPKLESIGSNQINHLSCFVFERIFDP